MILDGSLQKAQKLLEHCEAAGLRIVTVESCTGGLLAGCLTAVPGSSAVVERGYVTYSNEAKAEEVGVDPALIAAHGAVSGEVAAAMAEGALKTSPAELSASVTGVAGPGGGTDVKPVGLVFIGVARKKGSTVVEECRFPGDREAVRAASVEKALDMLLKLVEGH